MPDENRKSVLDLPSVGAAELVSKYETRGRRELVVERRRRKLEVTGANQLLAMNIVARSREGGASRTAVAGLFHEEVEGEVKSLARFPRKTLDMLCEQNGLPDAATNLGQAIYIAANPGGRNRLPHPEADRFSRFATSRSGTSRPRTEGEDAAEGLNDDTPSFTSPFAHLGPAALGGLAVAVAVGVSLLRMVAIWISSFTDGGSEVIFAMATSLSKLISRVAETIATVAEANGVIRNWFVEERERAKLSQDTAATISVSFQVAFVTGLILGFWQCGGSEDPRPPMGRRGAVGLTWGRVEGAVRSSAPGVTWPGRSSRGGISRRASS